MNILYLSPLWMAFKSMESISGITDINSILENYLVESKLERITAYDKLTKYDTNMCIQEIEKLNDEIVQTVEIPLIDRLNNLESAIVQIIESKEQSEFEINTKELNYALEWVRNRYEIEQNLCFGVDSEMIKRIHKYCIDTAVFECDVKLFSDCVRKSNFNKIKPLPKAKNKLYSLIHTISFYGKPPTDWYTLVTNNLGIDKKHCSGAKVNISWKGGLIDVIQLKSNFKIN